LILIGVVMCFTYYFVAIHRLALSGFSLFNSEDILKWIIESTNKPRLFAWNLEDFVYGATWLHPLLGFGFALVTFFELTAPLALLSKPYRVCFIPVMILFHVLSWIFFSIFFWEETLLYLVFFEWYRKK